MNIWELYPNGTTSATLLQERVKVEKREREARLMRQYGTTDAETIKKILKAKKA